MTTFEDLDFSSPDGTPYAARRYHGDPSADLAGSCIVMANNVGSAQDSGLGPFADRFSAAGADVLLFDYQQRADLHAALAHCRRLDGIDPDRLVLWGFSFGGGHVIDVAADEPHLAAVIALVPVLGGISRLRAGLRHTPPINSVRKLARSKEAAPAAASPSEWRNEISAPTVLKSLLTRPQKRNVGITCPVLLQVGDFDQTAPAAPAIVAGQRASHKIRVRHYPCDHFDVLPKREWFDSVCNHQHLFLSQTLAAAPHSVSVP